MNRCRYTRRPAKTKNQKMLFPVRRRSTSCCSSERARKFTFIGVTWPRPTVDYASALVRVGLFEPLFGLTSRDKIEVRNSLNFFLD
jgi:hypothetical protein